MTTVPRHEVNSDAAAKVVEALAAKNADDIDRIETDPGALKSIFRRGLKLTRYRTVLDPTAAEAVTWLELRIAAQAGTALLRAAAGEGEIDAVVARPVRFPATGPTSYANAGTWLTVTWLAVIDRNDTLLRQLAAIPLDALRASGAEHDAYLYPWVETVQNFLVNREVTAELFGTVMDGTDPDTVQRTAPEVMLRLIYPPIEMFYHLLRRDSGKFTDSLARAAEQHRRFWTGNRELAADPGGFVALAPLAVAVLARSAGMTVDVESGYLPANFLRGTHRQAMMT
ncbi:immunity 49 family protein [Amycolatopsis suaedae]|uniref:Immunity 49 family protein n=1 Tax=Amycolatopsis suaedae TaxID=2510978 RepID=A0A4Q7J960_9PSEU|nr:immunity 49 family protein [Amycolatopsis suaedae]RZQ63538.1 hypothetical protein EWH70_14025 [Amycolatopsis suaedae]